MISTIFTRIFWMQTTERAIKTAAQAALALLALDAAPVLSLAGVDWVHLGSVAALAALGSVLTSLVSAGIGPAGSPSVVELPEAPSGRHALRDAR